MIKDKEYYMSIDYDIIVTEISSEDGGGHLAYYNDIKGVMGDGTSKEEAIQDVKSAFKSYIEVSLLNKDTIPEPIELDKTRRINISMTNRRILSIDKLATTLNLDRSKIISKLLDQLLNGDIQLKPAR